MYRWLTLLVAAALSIASCSGSDEGTATRDSSTVSTAVTQTIGNTVAEPPVQSDDGELTIDTGWQSTTLNLAPGEFTVLKHPWLAYQAFMIEVDPVGEIDVVLVDSRNATDYNSYLESLTDDEISDSYGRQSTRVVNCLAETFGSPFEPARVNEEVDVAQFDDVSVTVNGETVAPLAIADYFSVGKSEANVQVNYQVDSGPTTASEQTDVSADTDVYWLIGSFEGGELTLRTRVITPPNEVRRDPDEADLQQFYAPFEAEMNQFVDAAGEPDNEYPPWCPF